MTNAQDYGDSEEFQTVKDSLEIARLRAALKDERKNVEVLAAECRAWRAWWVVWCEYDKPAHADSGLLPFALVEKRKRATDSAGLLNRRVSK